MTTTASPPFTLPPPRTSRTWIYGPTTDMLLAWAWVPLFALTRAVQAAPAEQATAAVVSILGWVLLASLLHQPLTLLLVYGDLRQFRARRRLFVLTPLVGIPLLAAAVLADLWIVVPLAALWQVFHTQQQRYGFLRIYARKARYGSSLLDRAVSYTPLALGVVAIALSPATAQALNRFGGPLGAADVEKIRALLGARDLVMWAAVPVAALALATVMAYAAQEWRRAVTSPDGGASLPKWNYLFSGFVLVSCLVLDPVAGLVAYIAAHAIEYTIVVQRTLAARYASGDSPHPGLLAAASATPRRRALLLVGCFGVLGVLDLQLRGLLPTQPYLIVIYAIGVLHFVYDGFIWRTRKPSVAADFGIPTPVGGAR